LEGSEGVSKANSWKWEREPDGVGRILRDGQGRNRANVWSNGTWHTWDEAGTGGENGVCEGRYRVIDAMDQAMAAVVRQGWTPWKVEYPSVQAHSSKEEK
jgi:hypothetical protein